VDVEVELLEFAFVLPVGRELVACAIINCPTAPVGFETSKGLFFAFKHAKKNNTII
jgi:hypothetical protein